MFELGNNLREARQRRRIDLVIAEQDTKIRSKYLAALETEDFDVLPGPVFIRGFLRTYSRYLGLDPQMFIDEYNARFGRFEDVEEPSGPALGRPGLAQVRLTRGRRTMRAILVASLVVVAALAWLGLREEQEPTPPKEQPVTTGSPTTAAPERTAGALGEAARAAAAGTSATPADPGTGSAAGTRRDGERTTIGTTSPAR